MHQFIQRLTSAALIAFSFYSASSFAVIYRGTVLKVVDGDTINMMPLGAPVGAPPFRIRMLATDTAETHLPAPGGMYSQGFWGEAGANQLRSLVQVGDVIDLQHLGYDKYGRVLGVVFKNRININLQMIASGWAALYEICDGVICQMASPYRSACRDAVAAGRGLFDPRNPIPQLPFVFRAEKQNRVLSKFVGDYRTGKYVTPENFEAVPICERIFFLTENEALARGFTPAN